MDYIYLITACYRHEWTGMNEFSNICFKTQKEAIDFCKFHDDKDYFHTYRKIAVGSFKNPRKKKKTTT